MNSHQRKTPGWLADEYWPHAGEDGLKITDEERRAVVKFLADKQGLVPQ
ncbi:MAG: hypothetical protein QM805_23845 [Pseudomonas sp.]